MRGWILLTQAVCCGRGVSIYSEMLKLVLAGDNDDLDRSVGALVSDALSSRSHLMGVGTGQPAARSGRAADRVAESLAYDAALVRLCNRLGLEQDLTGGGTPTPPGWARRLASPSVCRPWRPLWAVPRRQGSLSGPSHPARCRRAGPRKTERE